MKPKPTHAGVHRTEAIMKYRISRTFTLVAALTALCASQDAVAQQVDRTVLPIPEPQPPVVTELSARDVSPPARFDVKAPQGAPNVVVVLLDDIGFGQSSAFGGSIKMPTLDKLAAGGLRFNNFHTTALCSPTRTALLTGRNHHVNNAGAIMELATAFPGNTGIRPQSVAPLAEMLRLNGYSTGAFGKYHETPPWEVSVSGPYDRWPTHSGFDKFYGFIGGETNQWAPAIFDGTVRVEQPHSLDYRFTVDMTNQAIAWMQAQLADTGQAVFRVLRHGRAPRPPSRAEGIHRPIPRQVRSGLGCAARGDICAPEEDGHRAAKRRPDQAAQGDPVVGIPEGRSEKARGAADGDV